MKLVTTTGDYSAYGLTQTEALKHIRSAGFRYADYNFHLDRDRKSGIYSNGHERYFDEVGKTAELLGIKLVQGHSPMGRPLQDADGAFLRDTLRCIDACGTWGIKNLVVHSGYLRGLSPEKTLEENKKFFLPLLERAERYGVNILVENFDKMTEKGYYWIDNAPDLLRMVELVDHPLFHAVWDVGHGNMQTMPQDEALRLLGKHIFALHIHDNMGERDSHLTPFLGSLNFDSVMNGLREIGYNGYFTFEVGGVFVPAEKRRRYEKDKRLEYAPIEVRDAYEHYLYELGKCILEKYGCFEE